MYYAQYTEQRLRAFLDNIGRLLEIEFPYSHSKQALEILEQFFYHKSTRRKVKQNCQFFETRLPCVPLERHFFELLMNQAQPSQF